MIKKELNSNIYFSEGNEKLVGSDGVSFLAFPLPAVHTCYYKTPVCEAICYARNEEQRFPVVRDARLRNYLESKKPNFINDVIQILKYNLERPKNQGKKILVRIHTSGDFYSLEYLKKWLVIAAHFHFKNEKRIIFQAYTKALPLIQEIEPKHRYIKFIYSIMSDTHPEHIAAARAEGLTTFEAKHESKLLKNDKVCSGQCGPCLRCYTGRNGQKIVVAQHGNRKNKAM